VQYIKVIVDIVVVLDFDTALADFDIYRKGNIL